MKNLFYLLLLPLMVMMAACDEDDPAPIPGFENKDLLEWEVVSNSSPKYIHANYSSPDPGCGVPKLFYIDAKVSEGHVVVRCTNGTDLTLGDIAYEGKYTMAECMCLVTQIDSNTFDFEFLPTEKSANQYLDIKGTFDNKSTKTTFIITRIAE